MKLFGFGSSNKFVDDLEIRINAAAIECNKMIFDHGAIIVNLQETQNQIKEYEGRKKFLKGNENVVVDMEEYRFIKTQLFILYNNENVLNQHIENFEISIERCKKHIENLEKQRDQSQFKVLEFKKRGAG